MYAVDFETYFDPKTYSLRKMPMFEYITDPRFKALLLAVKNLKTGETTLLRKDEITPERLAFLNGQIIVAHNVQFDGAILHWRYGIKAKRWYCTAAMARGWYPRLKSANLATVAKEVLGTEKLADLNEDRLSQEEFEAYCLRDVELCAALFKRMLKEGFPRSELEIIHLISRMYIEPTLRISREILENIILQRLKLRKLLCAAVGVPEETLRKRDKVLRVLKRLGVPEPIDATTGRATLSKKNPTVIDVLLGKYGKEAKRLMEARIAVASTIEDRRAERLISMYERLGGKLAVPLLYYGAHTGRSSGGDKINLQNLPRKSKLRDAIIAPPGHKIVVADSSQIEARMLAWWCKEWQLVEAFANDEDIYSIFASKAFNKHVTKETDPTARFIGKTCILGLGYGMNAPKLLYTLKSSVLELDQQARDFVLGLTDTDAHSFVRTYRNTYARINSRYGLVDSIIKSSNCRHELYPVTIESGKREVQITLPNGMLIVRDKVETNVWYGLIIENIIQALARIVVFNQALALDAMGFRVVHFVHDEIVLCVPDEQVDEAAQAIDEVMRTPPVWAKGLPLDCEYEVGECYVKP